MKQLFRIFSVIAIIFFASKTIAQESFQLQGRIVDSITNKGLPNATIQVFNSKNKLLVTGYADSLGNYVINLPINIATNYLTASYVGYESKVLFYIPSTNNAIATLPIIKLTSFSKNLSELIIQSEKLNVVFKPDRQVYKASQFANAISGNAVDILRNLPSISVNVLGDIQLRGSSNFLLLINGKPIQGDVSTILSQLPAGTIENIEMITSPGASFDADGKSGAINIITKTNTQDGIIFQSNSMIGAPPLEDYTNRRTPKRYNAEFFIGYKKNKVDFTVAANYLRNDIAGNRDGDVYTIQNNIQTNFPSFGERSFKRYNTSFRTSVNYALNNSNYINAGFYIGKRFQSRVADLLYNNSKVNLQNGTTQRFTYFNANDQQKTGVFTLGNFEYKHQFNSASNIVATFLYEKADLSANTYNSNLAYPNIKDTLQYTFNTASNPLTAYRLKLDYTYQWKKITLLTGYQFRKDDQVGNFLYYATNASNQLQIDPTFSSGVTTRNSIHGFYISASGLLQKINFSGGLRIEHANRKLFLSSSNTNSPLTLTNIFPSILLKYPIAEKLSAKLSYNRRVKRTNNFELNPIPEREHSETLEQGDAALLPEFITIIETGVEKTILNGNAFLNFYFQETANPIQRVNKVFNDTILNRVFTNAGKGQQFGVEINYSQKLNSFWQTTIGGNGYYYSIKGAIFNNTIPIQNRGYVFSVNTTQSFNFGKNWSSQFSIQYLSERITAQGEDSRFFTPNLTLRKQSANKMWSFQFSWLNMDLGLNESNRQRITTRGVNFYTTTNYIYETDQLQFSINYSLTKRNRNYKLPSSEIGEKEF